MTVGGCAAPSGRSCAPRAAVCAGPVLYGALPAGLRPRSGAGTRRWGSGRPLGSGDSGPGAAWALLSPRVPLRPLCGTEAEGGRRGGGKRSSPAVLKGAGGSHCNQRGRRPRPRSFRGADGSRRGAAAMEQGAGCWRSGRAGGGGARPPALQCVPRVPSRAPAAPIPAGVGLFWGIRSPRSPEAAGSALRSGAARAGGRRVPAALCAAGPLTETVAQNLVIKGRGQVIGFCKSNQVH